MKKILPIKLYLLAVFVFVSCSNDNDSPSNTEMPVLSNFTVNTANTNITSINLEWTAATMSDNSPITYDVYLDEVRVGQNLAGTSFTINSLESETSYTGKVVAKSSQGLVKEKTYSFITKKNETPSAFEFDVEVLSKSEARITWTASTVTSGSAILYDLIVYDDYFNEETIIEDVSELTYVLSDLYHGSVNQLTIVAKTEAGATTSVEKTFQTYGTPPSDFTLSYEQITPDFLVISWGEHPTVSDGSNYKYDLYVNGELLRSFNNEGDTDTVLQDLVEGAEYTVLLVADASIYNNTQTEATISFTAETYPAPADDFELSVTTMSATKLFLDWTPSSTENETTVIYYLYVNGERINPSNYYSSYQGAILEDLLPDTEYTIRVEADATGYFKTVSKSITFRTYPVHPTIAVEQAVLYETGSQFFEQQLNVSFNQNIENVDITYFHAGKELDIPNFIFYPSAISSPTLDLIEESYFFYIYYPYGYVLVRENGTSYIVDFDVVLGSN